MEVDKYFHLFETIAVNSEWPNGKWSLLLQSVIKGKAQHVYTALSVGDAMDYEKLKKVIMQAYELIPDEYRERFRNLRKSGGKKHVEFAYDKVLYFERWVTSKEVNGDYEKLKELIFMEEFKRRIPEKIRIYLNEKDVATLQASAKLADEYALIHRNKFSQGSVFKTKCNMVNQGKPEVKTEVSEKSKVILRRKDPLVLFVIIVRNMVT